MPLRSKPEPTTERKDKRDAGRGLYSILAVPSIESTSVRQAVSDHVDREAADGTKCGLSSDRVPAIGAPAATMDTFGRGAGTFLAAILSPLDIGLFPSRAAEMQPQGHIESDLAAGLQFGWLLDPFGERGDPQFVSQPDHLDDRLSPLGARPIDAVNQRDIERDDVGPDRSQFDEARPIGSEIIERQTDVQCAQERSKLAQLSQVRHGRLVDLERQWLSWEFATQTAHRLHQVLGNDFGGMRVEK